MLHVCKNRFTSITKSFPLGNWTGTRIGINNSTHARDANNQNAQPLAGIRILDLTRIVAGPYCTMLLGDLGAEVIKIERPGSGDEARKWGPPWANNSNESCYFLPMNRNKYSVSVDIKSKEGKEIIYDLAMVSDVLVENYVPGKLAAIGLGYKDLKAIAPQLIYCSITGYGSEGPYNNKPGYDVIAASRGGLLHVTGPQNGEPTKVGVAMTDVATGLYAHGAILAALFHRNEKGNGQGQKIDVNLLSTQLACLINIGSSYLNGNQEGKRWGTGHESIVPYQSFKTKDGYYTVGTGSDKQFDNFCDMIGKPELAEMAKFKTNQVRVANRVELIDIIQSVFVTKTNQEWETLFTNVSFPNGPVNSLRRVFEDPHVKAIGIVKEVEHTRAGKIKLVGPAVQYSETRNDVRIPPPALGEHTEEILRRVLQFDDGMLHKLKKINVIK